MRVLYMCIYVYVFAPIYVSVYVYICIYESSHICVVTYVCSHICVVPYVGSQILACRHEVWSAEVVFAAASPVTEYMCRPIYVLPDLGMPPRSVERGGRICRS